MIGYMHYNKFGNDGFTDRGKARTTSSVQTCPVCLPAVPLVHLRRSKN